MAKYYYNGVLLPEVPSVVLDNYPYYWIRKNNSTGQYQLICAAEPWYYTVSNSCNYSYAYDASVSNCIYFSISQSSASTLNSWGTGTMTTAYFGSDANRPTFWSNHDIVLESNGTDIYFATTDITPEVPVDDGTAIKYYYNGVLLPEVPVDILKEYPYCWMRTNNTLGDYELIFGKQHWYYNSGMTCIDGNDELWYRIPMDVYETAACWVLKSATTGSFGIDGNRTLLWANHTIYSGSLSSVYMELKEPEPQYPDDRIWYKIEQETLTSFADEARRIGNTTDPLSTEQMLEIFKAAGQGDGSGGVDKEIATIFYNGVYTLCYDGAVGEVGLCKIPYTDALGVAGFCIQPIENMEKWSKNYSAYNAYTSIKYNADTNENECIFTGGAGHELLFITKQLVKGKTYTLSLEYHTDSDIVGQYEAPYAPFIGFFPYNNSIIVDGANAYGSAYAKTALSTGVVSEYQQFQCSYTATSNINVALIGLSTGCTLDDVEATIHLRNITLTEV